MSLNKDILKPKVLWHLPAKFRNCQNSPSKFLSIYIFRFSPNVIHKSPQRPYVSVSIPRHSFPIEKHIINSLSFSEQKKQIVHNHFFLLAIIHVCLMSLLFLSWYFSLTLYGFVFSLGEFYNNVMCTKMLINFIHHK